ncbi:MULTISPECIES: zf-HC2 domain-containing protein [unclassified Paenibacillus]|uniref:zf-HC2 domain-containing protein n=1 Tax=unclassified Paenibacillus TaxID=185978 RepID=UPI000954D85A|nr:MULTISPECIES: zf-HC2 domain-containing protein [unclassified Paenibacillus]ASS68253.1 anti-sigma factor [Paenibacillus sp. RUD330]SIR25966.1 Transmembrane transcriptional regulator (anti-sigma factor RsiW) [Paenibacillus sp. RU4X]SIR39121.1 Transmembrane transcriptional regulator (anti-sigma factor RsiW) [Paenibacillus sp. RU4T]
MKCNVAIVWMHDYIDGELPREDAVVLKEHLLSCPGCRARFEQLEKTEALLSSAMTEPREPMLEPAASAALTERILKQIPPPARHRDWTGWIRRHPALTAAAVFVLVMLASFAPAVNNGSELIVRGDDLRQVVIDGHTVIVPEGAHLKGSLTVENGIADVRGDVQGSVTVVDGSLLTASTAHIAGQTRKIDQLLDRLWYKVTQTFGSTP